MFGGGDPQLIVEAVVPDFGHVDPVGDNAVLDGVLQFKDSLLGLSLLSDVGIFVVHAHHNVLILGGSHDGWEGGSRSVIT